MSGNFIGAKLALFAGDTLVVILRDARPDIPWPGHWDLPGGGREGAETPLSCALRETREELGLSIDPRAVKWGKAFDGPRWFFAAHLPAQVVEDIVFGNEGQGWAVMTPRAYCAHPRAIPRFVQRLQFYLAGAAGDPFERPPAQGGGS